MDNTDSTERRGPVAAGHGAVGESRKIHPLPLGEGAKREPDRAKPQEREGLKI